MSQRLLVLITWLPDVPGHQHQLPVLTGGGGDGGVDQPRYVLSVLGHQDYWRTDCSQLPELGQVVDEGVEDYRDDEVSRAVFVPAVQGFTFQAQDKT